MTVPFDYSGIPEGYYDQIANGPNGVRKFWHYHKFESVVRYIPPALMGPDKRVLDVGCFAGTFLGMIPKELFGTQVGIDILPNQIAYAQKTYNEPWRKFQVFDEFFRENREKFHVITLIEVIEHLTHEQIRELLGRIRELLLPEGRLILTTPNYFSVWPLLEIFLNRESDVKYEEQHITKFTYFNLEPKLIRVLQRPSFKLEAKTTTHFISPAIAGLNYEMAIRMAHAVPASNWGNPLGCIVLSRWSVNS